MKKVPKGKYQPHKFEKVLHKLYDVDKINHFINNDLIDELQEYIDELNKKHVRK